MSEMVIQSTIKPLQWIYAIVIALSIGEAFKEFVSSSDTDRIERGIHWDRLPLLASMMILVVPFYHGMARYFCEMYCAHGTDESYGKWLLFDCSVFTVEAGLFFILARSLPKQLWWRFCMVVMVILCVDIEWGAIVWKYRTTLISDWVLINLLTAPFLGAVLLRLRKSSSWWPVLLTCLIIIARTFVDYSIEWQFYFPK
jgi:hypothetical protein